MTLTMTKTLAVNARWEIVNGKWLNGLFFVTLHVEKCV